MELQGLTERIRRSADDNLRNEIHNAKFAFRGFFTDGCTQKIKMTVEVDGKDTEAVINAHDALSKLEELGFEVSAPQKRQAAIDAFMANVAKLLRDTDDLRQTVESMPQ